MTQRVFKEKKPSKREEQAVETTEVAPSEKVQKLREDIDDILDEIDEVLEENAEEFVKSYVQKGGE